MFDIFQNVINNSPFDPVDRIDSLSDVLAIILNLVVGVGFSICIITLAYAGIMFVLSGGDPKKTQAAYNTALWSIIAGIITLGAFAVKQIAARGVGVSDANILDSVPNI